MVKFEIHTDMVNCGVNYWKQNLSRKNMSCACVSVIIESILIIKSFLMRFFGEHVCTFDFVNICFNF